MTTLLERLNENLVVYDNILERFKRKPGGTWQRIRQDKRKACGT